ncbi:hypothetical protein ACFX13_009834 [Malus domestica]
MLMARSDVKCYCCGLTEECKPAYVATVKERHQDRWICGLCAEAFKDENSRSSFFLLKILNALLSTFVKPGEFQSRDRI